MDFASKLKETSTIHGAGLVVGAMFALAESISQHNVPLWVSLGMFASALVLIVMPENKPAASDIQQLVTDVAQSVITKKLMPSVLPDVVAALQSLQPAPAPVPVIAPATPVTSVTGIPAAAPTAAV